MKMANVRYPLHTENSSCNVEHFLLLKKNTQPKKKLFQNKGERCMKDALSRDYHN